MSTLRSDVRVNMEGSWVSVCTAFLVILLEMGILKSLGVLFNPMLVSLECTAAELGTVFGLTNSIGFIISPIAGHLARRHGSRVCMVVGAVLLFAGYFASAFVVNVFQLAITLGITTGLGMGLSYTPQMVVLVDSFPTTFPVIFSVAALGGSFGIIVCPPLVDCLLGFYGWRGTMMIIAAGMFNVIVFGALQKPHIIRNEYSRLESCGGTSGPKKVENNSSGFCGRAMDVFASVASWLSLNIFVDEPRVVLHLTVVFLQGLSSATWMIYLVPHAIARGIFASDAALLSTGGGVGNLVARVINIALQKKKVASAFLKFEVFGLLNAVAMFLDTVAGDNFMILMTLASVNGATIGLLNVIFYLVAKEIYDDRHHLDLLFLGNCFYGLGEIVGSFLAGSTYDLMHSFDAVFLGLGAVSVLSVALMLMDRIASRCK